MPLVQIRIFGFKAEGTLARPWKAPNPFGDLMGQMEEKKEEIAADKSGDEQQSETSDSEIKSSGVKASGVKSRKPRKEE